MTVDDGSYTFSVIAASLRDLLAGKLPTGPPLLRASSLLRRTFHQMGNA